MRIVLQRVSHASVNVAGTRIADIGQGLLLLVGIASGDSDVDLARTASKIVNLRIFEDEAHKMNRSLRDIEGEVLAVSQFTLYADVSKGRRPSFIDAAPPELAAPLFDAFVRALKSEGVEVQTGEFGAKMAVELENDGPVTLTLEVAA
ncbi:D-aminoacyl-tRNA deacylase [Candidatus Bipolaricaulota bacterium]